MRKLRKTPEDQTLAFIDMDNCQIFTGAIVMRQIGLVLSCWAFSCVPVFSWNGYGHMEVAAVARHRLNDIHYMIHGPRARLPTSGPPSIARLRRSNSGITMRLKRSVRPN